MDIAFPEVAVQASTNSIRPRQLAPAGARKNVVQGELMRWELFPAVLKSTKSVLSAWDRKKKMIIRYLASKSVANVDIFSGHERRTVRLLVVMI